MNHFKSFQSAINLVFLSAILNILCSLPGFASSQAEIPEHSCTAYEAEYAPDPWFKPGGDVFDYRIRIKPYENPRPPTTPIAYFILDTFQPETNKHLSSVKLEYGSTPNGKTFLSVGDDQKTYTSYTLTLNKDFSPAFIQVGEKIGRAPDVIIIPDLHTMFRFVDWNTVKTIKYFNNEENNPRRKIPPGRLVPTIWFFQRCLDSNYSQKQNEGNP